MRTQSSMIHIRVDDETKEKATATLNALGLSVSDAVRLFLKRVVIEQAVPLDLKVPIADTRAAISEADMIAEGRFHDVDDLVADLEKNRGK